MSQNRLSDANIVTIARYLERYAEPEAAGMTAVPVSRFDALIVIPIYDEAENQLQHFLNFNNGRSVVMIWVFNAPEASRGLQTHQRTVELHATFVRRLNAQPVAESCHLARLHSGLQLLLVDRCQHLIPDKQGVGLARKLGADLALQLSYQQYLQSGCMVPWIYSTDADVRLPNDYAMLDDAASDLSACVHPFVHSLESGYEQAMRQYEFSLHYYVDRLHSAGSPYAFHTIGSLLAIKPLAYAQVRGFPKRAGAEDFYLLNKLAKVSRVSTLSAPVLEIAGRPSHRVPFGTGPALMKISEAQKQQKNFQIYHPQIFQMLHGLLASLAQIEKCISESAIFLYIPELTMLTEQEGRVVKEVLCSLGWEKQQAHFRQQKNSEAFRQAFHTWFDGFLTLRFVHEIRDRLYANIDLAELPDYLTSDDYTGSTIDYIAWFEALGISR